MYIENGKKKKNQKIRQISYPRTGRKIWSVEKKKTRFSPTVYVVFRSGGEGTSAYFYKHKWKKEKQ